MKMIRAAAAAAALFAAAAPSFAADFTIDFERAWDYNFGDVNGYYNGGTAADGSSGANLGVSFVNLSGLSNDADFTYYTNAPSMLGTAYAHVFGNERAFMNVAAGVEGGLSFFYAATVNVVGAVTAWSGLNGTGTLLGTIDLTANGSAYDAWNQATLTFGGVAHSFDFTNAALAASGADGIGFDNISAVPEPGALLTMLIGGLGIAGAAARRRRAR